MTSDAANGPMISFERKVFHVDEAGEVVPDHRVTIYFHVVDEMFSLTPPDYLTTDLTLSAESVVELVNLYEEMANEYQRKVLGHEVTTMLAVMENSQHGLHFDSVRVVNGELLDTPFVDGYALLADIPANVEKLMNIQGSFITARDVIERLVTADDAQAFFDSITFFDRPATIDGVVPVPGETVVLLDEGHVAVGPAADQPQAELPLDAEDPPNVDTTVVGAVATPLPAGASWVASLDDDEPEQPARDPDDF